MKKNSVVKKAYAKINLFFEALYKRDDGFHEVRTVMQSISLHDELHVSISATDSFVVEGGSKDIPTDERNIVIKALNLYRSYSNSNTRFNILLKKNIPSQAGLSGGSADCAQALLAFNQLDGQKLSFKDLEFIGSKLGSDVNFHLYGGLAACFGKGEKIELLPSLEYSGNCYIVMPGEKVSTEGAYKKIKKVLTFERKNSNFNYLFKRGYKLDGCCSLTKNIYNQFEEVVYEDRQSIKLIKEEIEKIGVDRVWMTGSGSALVVFSKDNVLDSLQQLEDIESIFTVKLIK